MERASTAGLGKAHIAGIQRELKEHRERTIRLEATVAELVERVTALERNLAVRSNGQEKPLSN